MQENKEQKGVFKSRKVSIYSIHKYLFLTSYIIFLVAH